MATREATWADVVTATVEDGWVVVCRHVLTVAGPQPECIKIRVETFGAVLAALGLVTVPVPPIPPQDDDAGGEA